MKKYLLYIFLTFIIVPIFQELQDSKPNNGTVFDDVTGIYKIPLNSSPEQVEVFMERRNYFKTRVTKDGSIIYSKVRIGRIPALEVAFVFLEKKLNSINIVWTISENYKKCAIYFNVINKRLIKKYGAYSDKEDGKIKFKDLMINEFSRTWKINEQKYAKRYMIKLDLRASDISKDKDFVKIEDWSEYENDEDKSKKNPVKEPQKIRVTQLYTFFEFDDPADLEDF